MFRRISNYILLLFIILFSGCNKDRLLTVSGSVAYDGNKGWIFMVISSDPLHYVMNAGCVLDSFYTIPYQDTIQSYYRELSTITPHSTHTIDITVSGYLPVSGKATIPSNFNIFNLNTTILAGDSLPVLWGLVDGISLPEEWYITLTHNNFTYYSASLPPDSTSIIIKGNNFPAAGTYELSIYGIIYGSLNNVSNESDFAGVIQRRISIIVKGAEKL